MARAIAARPLHRFPEPARWSLRVSASSCHSFTESKVVDMVAALGADRPESARIHSRKARADEAPEFPSYQDILFSFIDRLLAMFIARSLAVGIAVLLGIGPNIAAASTVRDVVKSCLSSIDSPDYSYCLGVGRGKGHCRYRRGIRIDPTTVGRSVSRHLFQPSRA